MFRLTHFLYILITWIVLPLGATGQYFNVFDIETGQYPLVKAKYLYNEEETKAKESFSIQELDIFENAREAEIIDIKKPEAVTKNALSIVLAFDVSSSMTGERLDIAKEAGIYLIDKLNTAHSECAIASFDHLNYLNLDFTKNKEQLKQTMRMLEPRGGTSYNAGFQFPFGGALHVAKEGKHKKVVIFLTDGKGEGDEEKIIEMANNLDVAVYPVTVELDMPGLLKNVAAETGGEFFENVNSVSEARDIYEKILVKSTVGSYGEITWRSPSSCKKDILVDLTVGKQSVNAAYEIPEKYIARLQIDPRFLIFSDQTKNLEQSFSVKALNAPFSIEGFTNPNEDVYTIQTASSFPLKLNRGEEQKITIRKKSPVDKPLFSQLLVHNDQCPDYTVYVKDGELSADQVPLEVIYPNGGEVFSAGTKAFIQWKGMNEQDSVNIFFSENNGISWELIKKDAGLETDWQVPAVEGETNLVKVTQGRKQTEEIRMVLLNELYGSEYSAHNASFSRKGNFIITSEDDNSIKLWDAATGQFIQQYNMHRDWVYSVDNSFDEKMLLSASEDGTAKLFSLNTGQGRQILKAGTWSVNKAVFTPDFTRIVTVSDDGVIRVWNTHNGEMIYRFVSHPGWVIDVAVSPDNKLMVTANDDNTIRLWSLLRRRHIATLKGHNDWVFDVDFSPDGNYILSAGKDGVFNIWNANSGRLMRSIRDHRDKVYTANFSPDGKYIITASRDRTVRLWDTYTGELIDIIMNKQGVWFRTAHFDYTGNRIIATDSEGEVYVWLLKEQEPFMEDVSDKTFRIVSPKPHFEMVNMGSQIVGQRKEILIKDYFSLDDDYPSKIKKVAITGKDERFFDIVSGFTSGTMEPGTFYELEFSFHPERIGDHEAQLRVNTATDTLYKPITGKGVDRSYEIPLRYVNMGKVQLPKYRDTTLTVLKNAGSLPLNLEQPELEGPAKEHFSLLSKLKQTTLKRGEELKLRLRFKPGETGRLQALVSLKTENYPDKEKIMILGEGLEADPVHFSGVVRSRIDSTPLQSRVTAYLMNGQEYAVYGTRENGQFSFKLNQQEEYRLTANKKGYIPEGIHVDLSEVSHTEPVQRDIYLSPVEEGSKARLDNVFFEFASAQLKASSYGELNQLTEFLEKNPGVKIRLEGHTDSIGTKGYNQRLSQSRAAAVKEYLIKQGIVPERIRAKGFGESQPVADNSTEKGRALNRRVEVVILSKE